MPHSKRVIPRLDVRDLEVVLAVAESGSTTRAASSLHITQPAVSRALLLAEEKIGQRLFERGARGIVPTAAGRRLVAGAGNVLLHMMELEKHVEAPDNEATRVRVVCECYTAYRWLPSALQTLARTPRGIQVVLAPEHTDAPVSALDAGDVDVALLTTSQVSGHLADEPLFSDEFVFVVAPNHPLAQRSSLRRRDLAEHTLITGMSTPAAERRWFLRRVFGKTRPKLEWLRFPLTEAIVDAARAGMGVAVMSEWIASAYLASGGLAVRRLETGPLHRSWRFAYRRESAEMARRLASALAGAPPRIYGSAAAASSLIA